MKNRFYIPRLRVGFDESKNVVHTMHVWLYAYKQARKGEWGQVARDRHRFKRRIQKIEDRLSHIFTEDHRLMIKLSRLKIYEKQENNV